MYTEGFVNERYKDQNSGGSNKNPIKKILNFIKNNKKVFLIGLLVIIVFFIIIFIIPKRKNVKFANNDANNIIAHTEEGIIKSEEYEGMKFDNISLITEDDYTTLTADVTNVSDSDITKERLHISLKDKDGNESVKLLVYIPNGLKKNETKTITATAHGTFMEVVSKEIVE